MKMSYKHVVFTVVAVAVSAATLAQSLEVTVRNIKEAKGTIRVGLFVNEQDFLKKAVQGKVVKAAGKEVTVVFEGLAAGDYAVSVIHDENENGELDTNIVGIPKEGFTFSNNAMGSFGPPSFEKAKVTLGGSDHKQVVDLKYF
jgi:uncharacterized protein (DUF2141 family)